MTDLQSRVMTIADREAACDWRYEGPYAVYNLPPYHQLAARGEGIADPARWANYRSYLAGDVLVGFTNTRERDGAVILGIGVHPVLCGRGYGERILRHAVDAARAQHPGMPVCLAVRTWNARAIRCYEKVGFAVCGRPFRGATAAGEDTFLRMVHLGCGEEEQKEG